jgi:translation initiation factor IF-3
MELASAAKLDLVEISPNAEPPVCRVMDFGKHLYQLKKKKLDSRKKQHKTQIKELKYRPGIEEGDYQVKMTRLVKFINAGDKVKLTMRYRGREMVHHEIGAKLLNRIEKDVSEIAIVEQKPKFEGRQVVMVVAPKKK